MNGIYLSDIPVDLFMKYFSKESVKTSNMKPVMIDDNRKFHNLVFSSGTKSTTIKVYTEITNENIINTIIKRYVPFDYIGDDLGSTLSVSVGNPEYTDLIQCYNVPALNGSIDSNLYAYPITLYNADDDSLFLLNGNIESGAISEIGNEVNPIQLNTANLIPSTEYFGEDFECYKYSSWISIYGVRTNNFYFIVNKPAQYQKKNETGELLFKDEYGIQSYSEHQLSNIEKHMTAIRKSFYGMESIDDIVKYRGNPGDLILVYKNGSKKLSSYDIYKRDIHIEKIDQSAGGFSTDKDDEIDLEDFLRSSKTSIDLSVSQRVLENNIHFSDLPKITAIADNTGLKIANIPDKNDNSPFYYPDLVSAGPNIVTTYSIKLPSNSPLHSCPIKPFAYEISFLDKNINEIPVETIQKVSSKKAAASQSLGISTPSTSASAVIDKSDPDLSSIHTSNYDFRITNSPATSPAAIPIYISKTSISFEIIKDDNGDVVGIGYIPFRIKAPNNGRIDYTVKLRFLNQEFTFFVNPFFNTVVDNSSNKFSSVRLYNEGNGSHILTVSFPFQYYPGGTRKLICNVNYDSDNYPYLDNFSISRNEKSISESPYFDINLYSNRNKTKFVEYNIANIISTIKNDIAGNNFNYNKTMYEANGVIFSVAVYRNNYSLNSSYILIEKYSLDSNSSMYTYGGDLLGCSLSNITKDFQKNAKALFDESEADRSKDRDWRGMSVSEKIIYSRKEVAFENMLRSIMSSSKSVIKPSGFLSGKDSFLNMRVYAEGLQNLLNGDSLILDNNRSFITKELKPIDNLVYNTTLQYSNIITHLDIAENNSSAEIKSTDNRNAFEKLLTYDQFPTDMSYERYLIDLEKSSYTDRVSLSINKEYDITGRASPEYQIKRFDKSSLIDICGNYLTQYLDYLDRTGSQYIDSSISSTFDSYNRTSERLSDIIDREAYADVPDIHVFSSISNSSNEIDQMIDLLLDNSDETKYWRIIQ